jgi:hypothetical protein
LGGVHPAGRSSHLKNGNFSKMLEMYHFGRSYLEIYLADLGESMLVGKVI